MLVIYNSNVPESADVANYYAASRGVPASNLLGLAFSNDTEIPYFEYDSGGHRAAIVNKLNSLGSGNILYIVFSYRTPYKVSNAPLNTTVNASGEALDQYVAKIFDSTNAGSNPYYAPSQSKANQYLPFLSLDQFRSQGGPIVYSVWRVDGPTADIAKGLVDKAMWAEAHGLWGYGYFDKDVGGMYQFDDESGGTLRGDWDIYRAAEFTRDVGMLVYEDNRETVFGTAPTLLSASYAALYAGTHNLGRYNNAFTWNTGAIGFDFNSDTAANFRGGTIGNNDARWCSGALQSGITVTGGAIDEPFAPYISKYDGVFRNLFEGANVGDALLRNTPLLKWRLVNIGDPLYRPFPNLIFPRSSGPMWGMVDVNAAQGSAVSIYSQARTQSSDDPPMAMVRSYGRTLFGNNDSYNFVYQSLTGDGRVITRVSRTEQTGEEAQAGLMFRENNNPDSRFVSVTITGTGQLATNVRPDPGTFIGYSNGFILNYGRLDENPYPIWLQLARSGNSFTVSKSADGVIWTTVATLTANLPSTALAGLVTLSGNDATPNQTYYDGHAVQPFTCNYIYTQGQPPSGTCGYSCSDIGFCPGSVSYTPVLIDVNGDGFALTDASSGVSFDINADGSPEQVSWTAAGTDDAWLVLDRNGNGRIDNGAEMFGSVAQQRPTGDRNGFLALAVFDQPSKGGNGDGVVDARDAVFNSLRLWQDINHDGVSQPEELIPLAARGVASIELDYRAARRTDRYGNQFRYRAKVRGANGEQLGRWAWDVFLLPAR